MTTTMTTMTTKKCSNCEIEKDISLFGLQKGSIRSHCKSCINKKRNGRYKAPKPEIVIDELPKLETQIIGLKEQYRAQNEELFLQKELIKKLTEELKKHNLDVPVLDHHDQTYMYQFLYC